MGSKIGFEMNLIVVEAIRGRCASFTVLTATVSEIFGGQTTPSILVDLTRFNKIATQGAPQMAVDKEANSLSRVYSYYSKFNLCLFYV